MPCHPVGERELGEERKTMGGDEVSDSEGGKQIIRQRNTGKLSTAITEETQRQTSGRGETQMKY